jgi:hypothetical protein
MDLGLTFEVFMPFCFAACRGPALAKLKDTKFGIAPPAVYRGGESQDKLPAIEHEAVPLVGSPDAL